jgi:hypothetical protein
MPRQTEDKTGLFPEKPVRQRNLLGNSCLRFRDRSYTLAPFD